MSSYHYGTIVGYWIVAVAYYTAKLIFPLDASVLVAAASATIGTVILHKLESRSVWR